MTEAEFKAQKDIQIDKVEEPNNEPTPLMVGDKFEDYIPVLEPLRISKETLTADPTTTPRTYLEQFAFSVQSSVRYLHAYINGSWAKFKVGVVDKIVAGTGIRLSPTSGEGDVTVNAMSPFGNGEDGNVTISVDTTLTRDMFYDTLTVNASKILYPNGFRIFCKTAAVIDGTISVAGGNGGNGGNGGTVSGNNTRGAGGSAGTAGSTVSSGTIKGAIAALAGQAGFGGATGTTVKTTSDGTNEAYSFYSNSAASPGTGGLGGLGSIPGWVTTPGTNGTNTQVTKVGSFVQAIVMAVAGNFLGAGPSSGQASSGSGGNFSTSLESCGGGGGAGGNGGNGGILYLCAKTINLNSGGILSAQGGNGGTGGNGGNGSGGAGDNTGGGGGGGGAGGNGGAVILLYSTFTNAGTIIRTGGNGGSGGTGGSGAQGNGANGSAGGNGNTGPQIELQI